MRVIIFGLGNYYKEQKEKLEKLSAIQIVAFTDNNPDLWNKRISDVPVIPPDSLDSIVYDKVVIMSIYAHDISTQLKDLKVSEQKIIIWEEFQSQFLQGEIEVYSSEQEKKDIGGDVLIISTSLNYNGGSLAAVYGAMALKNRGMSVTLAVPEGNINFIEEAVNYGLTVVICPALPYLYNKEREMIEKFDIVLVNVLQMIKCASAVNQIRPTLWWIHEPFTIYDHMKNFYPDFLNEKKISGINIYAVSKRAKENFNKIYPDRIRNILQYGIPDLFVKNIAKSKKEKKLVFAIIGGINSLKSQDVFLNAVMKLKNRNEAEFWMIGDRLDDAYSKKVVRMAEKIESVKLLGQMTRKEIYEAFSEIDVVVCASQEEMLSIVITEAMMFGKTCITTDHTGNIDYIKDGVNGFIVPRNNPEALAERMMWIIENPKVLEKFGIEARKTYEKYFTMEIFQNNLEKALDGTKKKWIQRSSPIYSMMEKPLRR